MNENNRFELNQQPLLYREANGNVPSGWEKLCPRNDVNQLGNRFKGKLGRHNGRDVKRLSIPDIMSLYVPENEITAVLVYSFSGLWVGRVI